MLKKANQKNTVIDFKAAAFLSKGLADENRLRILSCISKGKKSVSAIFGELNLSQPLVSHHLKELKRFGLVKVERKGPFVYYEIATPEILKIMKMLDIQAANLLGNRTTF